MLRTIHWFTLALVPAGLLFAVINYVTAHVGSTLSTWGVPLVLYLFSLIVAFPIKEIIKPATTRALAAIGFIGVFFFASSPTLSSSTIALIWHVGAFFFIASALHQILALTKPNKGSLVPFYFVMLLGMTIGGNISVIIAPLFFNNLYEYSLLLISAGVLLLPYQTLIFRTVYQSKWLAQATATIADITLPILAVGLIWIAGKSVTIKGYVIDFSGYTNTFLWLVIILILAMISFNRPFRLALLAGLAVLSNPVLATFEENHILTDRSLYGAYSIVFSQEELAHKLINLTNNTVEGSQSIEPDKTLSVPKNLNGIATHLPNSIYTAPWVVVGLRVGEMACLSPQENSLVFIEKDPLIINIAQDSNYFTYLKNCKGNNTVINENWRKHLANYFDDKSLGMIIVNKFTDADTSELYKNLAKLKDDGIILINIANPHRDLLKEVSEQALAIGLVGVHNSSYVALARNQQHLGNLEQHNSWQPLP